MNDLTKLYMNVVKANQKLLDLVDDSQKFARSESILFKACTQALSHQTPYGTPAISQKFGGDGVVNSALEGLYDRIKPPGQKKNHIRRINQSKITEHTMYSVITPNPDLRIDEVGVPIGACIRMTVPEVVTEDNIEWLREAVIIGNPYERKSVNALNDWDIEKYFGGAKYIEPLGPTKYLKNLQDEPGGILDPFAVDEEGVNSFQMHRLHGIGRYLEGINAKYYNKEDQSGKEQEIALARKEYRYEFASNIRRLWAMQLKPGDIVHRCLRKHDMIMFNRAPSLTVKM